jgi:hypothetical protein
MMLKPSALIKECTSMLNTLRLDISCGTLSDLDNPLNKGFPFKFLTFYQDDFLKNHIVVYGEGIEAVLPRYDRRELFRWRAQRLLVNIEDFKDDLDMLQIRAGEVIRLIALLNGAESIEKNEIYDTIKRLGDEEVIEIFEAYLAGRKLDHNSEYWIEFTRSKIKKYLEMRHVNLI